MPLNRLTLVLNNCYEPCNVVAAKRALTLVHGGKAVVEIPSGKFIKTARMTVQIPSVIRLLTYRRVPRHNRTVSRKSILLRDCYTCQYCLTVFLPKDLTMDHVIPKSRSGSGSWTNLVTSCRSCNSRKGSRTPEEAGMPLLRKPAPIGIHGKHRLLMNSVDRAAWEPFLFVN